MLKKIYTFLFLISLSTIALGIEQQKKNSIPEQTDNIKQDKYLACMRRALESAPLGRDNVEEGRIALALVKPGRPNILTEQDEKRIAFGLAFFLAGTTLCATATIIADLTRK